MLFGVYLTYRCNERFPFVAMGEIEISIAEETHPRVG